MEGHHKLHVAMFPWLAFGHLIPYLELAKLIAQKGHKISFISTPRNIDRLQKIPPDLAPSVNLVKLTLPHEDNLPNNAEATSDIPNHKVQYLKIAFDGLQDGLAHFLETSSPDWIIYDFAAHWLPCIAGKLKISRAFFYTFNSWSICFFGPSTLALINGDDPRTELEHFTVPPEWVPFPSNVAFRQHEIKRAFASVQVKVTGISDICRFGWAMSGCDVFASRSCTELESNWLKLLGDLHQKPILPSGLLPPSLQGSRECTENTWRHISEWLNKQNKGYVVYVALGSEVTLCQNELTELALGLELSWLPFFWALRIVHDSVKLPDGFDERVKGRGVVWSSWAPQLSILGHESVGGFLTHCGWNSIIEGLNFGHALVMLPFWGDQGLNARVFEDKKVGKEIPRDEIDGSFTRNSVAETLRLVMVDKEGEIYRDKAKDMIEIFGDKNLHAGYVDKFVDYLENYRRG